VSTIPHTNAVTTLGDRRAGDRVNLETDIIGHYVEKLMRLDAPADASAAPAPSGITAAFLAANGF
jgi:riboflavin synthase